MTSAWSRLGSFYILVFENGKATSLYVYYLLPWKSWLDKKRAPRLNPKFTVTCLFQKISTNGLFPISFKNQPEPLSPCRETIKWEKSGPEPLQGSLSASGWRPISTFFCWLQASLLLPTWAARLNYWHHCSKCMSRWLRTVRWVQCPGFSSQIWQTEPSCSWVANLFGSLLLWHFGYACVMKMIFKRLH